MQRMADHDENHRRVELSSRASANLRKLRSLKCTELSAIAAICLLGSF